MSSDTYSDCGSLRADAWVLIDRLSYVRDCARRFLESPTYDEDYKVEREEISKADLGELLRVAEDLTQRIERLVVLK